MEVGVGNNQSANELAGGFDDFNKTAGKGEQTTPDGFLADLRELRNKIENKQTTQSDFQHTVGSYNSVVQMINNAIHIDALSHLN